MIPGDWMHSNMHRYTDEQYHSVVPMIHVNSGRQSWLIDLYLWRYICAGSCKVLMFDMSMKQNDVNILIFQVANLSETESYLTGRECDGGLFWQCPAGSISEAKMFFSTEGFGCIWLRSKCQHKVEHLLWMKGRLKNVWKRRQDVVGEETSSIDI